MALMDEGTPAVFVDKDGTLVENLPYNVDPARIVLADGAIGGLRLLHAAGFRIFVVSNQSGVARGYFSEQALDDVRRRLEDLLAEAGVPLEAFLYCPHHPDGIVERYAHHCDCRKPAPGMLLRAAERYGVALTRSWMIGDILDDVEAGIRARCRTALLDRGGETEWWLGPDRIPDVIARDLQQAARAILGTESSLEVAALRALAPGGTR